MKSKIISSFKKISFNHILILLYILFCFYIISLKDLFSNALPTGGDTASHFYPLQLLKETWQIRNWNPGNLFGEGLLVHYFPLPFIFMFILSFIFPLNISFVLVWALSILFLPLSVNYCLTKFKVGEDVKNISLIMVLFFLLNTSYSAWGGNIYSTICGQFAHAYALSFLFMLIGKLTDEINQERIFSSSSILIFSAITLSHSYIALCLPVLGLLLVLINKNLKKTATLILSTGVFGTLISAWWLLPAIDNAKWTTAYDSRWLEFISIKSYLPINFKYSLLTLIMLLIILFLIRSLRSLLFNYSKIMMLFISLSLFYFFMILIFPLIGLIDIRAIPQVQLFLFIILAFCISLFISKFPIKLKNIFIAGLLFLILFFSKSDILLIKNTYHRFLSGWEKSELFNDFIQLKTILKGDLSSPRIAYEMNLELNNKIGTVRAFEMSPYFFNRSVVDGLYQQSTIMAPYAFYFENLITPNKQCYDYFTYCPILNFHEAKVLMPNLGIDTLIISSEYSIKALQEMQNDFSLIGKTNSFSVFKINEEIKLVEILKKNEIIDSLNWKKTFINYFEKQNFTKALIVNTQNINNLSEKLNPTNDDSFCNPSISLQANSIVLTTNCPNRPHVLKFAYNSNFVSSSTYDAFFMVSPGFLGIIPTQTTTTIIYAGNNSWLFGKAVSALSIIVIFLIMYFQKVRYKKI